MPITHRVRQGECLSSIAASYGLLPETLWNDSDNAELREQRDENILLPGDTLTIPDVVTKQESAETEQRHRFRRKGVPEILRLRLVENDEPRADLQYVLIIDGDVIEGTTDGDGYLEHPIPPGAQHGELRIGEKERIPLDLGCVDPIDHVSGIQERLNNLGFACGEPTGTLDDRTRAAIRSFQSKHDLEPTGEMNGETKRKLKEIHGS